MFLEILQTLIKVLLLFSILIAAFGLSFYILLSRVSHTVQHIYEFTVIVHVKQVNNDNDNNNNNNNTF